MDAETARDLLAVIIDWPAASDGVRRAASNLWHDLAHPDNANPGPGMARLTGELRACRYDRHPGIRQAADALRAGLTGGEGLPWEPSGHDVFTSATRAKARAAGLDI